MASIVYVPSSMKGNSKKVEVEVNPSVPLVPMTTSDSDYKSKEAKVRRWNGKRKPRKNVPSTGDILTKEEIDILKKAGVIVRKLTDHAFDLEGKSFGNSENLRRLDSFVDKVYKLTGLDFDGVFFFDFTYNEKPQKQSHVKQN